MDGADHLFAIILLVSGAVGFFRGFIRESIALASWLIGLWLAWHFAYIVNPWLGGALAEPGVREWTGRAIVLLLVLLFGALVGSIVSLYARRAVGLAAMDRILGAAFGLA
ncbi:MAG TPA: CvpA family protein, partial [Steroidobacteraceae bacterium]|nr:CvpA family protein [Steroidobacteraceae bacterium]